MFKKGKGMYTAWKFASGFISIKINVSDFVPEGYEKIDVPIFQENFCLLIDVSLFSFSLFKIALV